MQPADRKTFLAIVNGMVAAKPGGKITPEALEVWWNAMHDWSIEDFRAAASELVKTCEFMPNPYHFHQLRRAGELKGPEAWTLVLNGAELDPNSRVYRAAQCVGGQYYIRHANLERDVPHIERRFLEAYEQLAEVEPIREALPQIAKPASRVTLRRPTAIANCLPAEVVRKQPSPAPAEALPALTAPEPRIAASVKVEKLARTLPTLTDEELARIAAVDVDTVRHVRAALESAA